MKLAFFDETGWMLDKWEIPMEENGNSTISLYLPARTAMVLREGEIRQLAPEAPVETPASKEKARKENCEKEGFPQENRLRWYRAAITRSI